LAARIAVNPIPPSARKSEPVLLAIDAGTDSMRVSAIDFDGRPLAFAKRAYRIALGERGEAEQDPDAIWRALCEAVVEVTSGEAGKRGIAGIGVTAALGLVVVTRDGTPLRQIMMWQDKRAVAHADALVAEVGRNGLFSRTGRPIDAELTGCKLAWLREHEPAVWERWHTAYTLKDWLVHRLTGERVTDPTSASYSMLFNVFTRQWDSALLDRFGLAARWDLPVRGAGEAAGELVADLAAKLGLRSGIPVAVGGPDGTMGAIGAGLIEPGSAVDVIGTTDVVFAVVRTPIEDRTRRTITNTFVDEGSWAIGGPLGLTGGALRWFAESFGPFAQGGDSDYAALDALADSVAPGAEALLFVPSLAGDRVPRWNASARGVVFGLSPRHGRAHVARALLEGCAFVVADTIDAISGAGAAIDEIRVAGGGATSMTWLRIRANALGRPLVVPEIIEASSLGAALAAGVAAGVFAGFADAIAQAVRVARVIEPDMRVHSLYRELRALMRDVQTGADPVFARLQSLCAHAALGRG